MKRTSEQKRLREEKDRVDREQAQQFQKNGNGVNESAQPAQAKNTINTGRSGGIGNAINMFNKAELKPIVPVQRVRIWQHSYGFKGVVIFNPFIRLIWFIDQFVERANKTPKSGSACASSWNS